jgi:hypothetical protein
MAKIFPDYLTDPVIVARLTGQGDVKMCYLGYLVDSEAAALAFLDAYADLGAEAVAGNDIEVGEGHGSFGGDTLLRLSEGGIPRESESAIPTVWELPEAGPSAGGYVLYADGHTEWKPYPGDFPMTEAVVERINALRFKADGE